MKTVAIILIIAGLLMIIINQVSYTKKEKVVDVGPLEVNKNETHRIGWPEYAGIAVLVVGAGMLVIPKTRKS